MGIFERCHASASAVTLAWIGVCIAPGTIVFTRILLLPHSIATALVIVRIEPLLALQAIIPGHPRDRNSGLEGKCVSLSLDLCGRRSIKIHINRNYNDKTKESKNKPTHISI